MGLLLILLLAAQAAAQEQTPLFRTTAAWVRVDVQVGERSRALSGLAKDDFVVYDEGAPQKILYFGHETEPLDAILLLDVSGSMRRYLEQMAATARQALAELHPDDRVAVMLFSRRTRLKENLTIDRQKVVEELKDAVRTQDLGSARASTRRFSTRPPTWRNKAIPAAAPSSSSPTTSA